MLKSLVYKRRQVMGVAAMVSDQASLLCHSSRVVRRGRATSWVPYTRLDVFQSREARFFDQSSLHKFSGSSVLISVEGECRHLGCKPKATHARVDRRIQALTLHVHTHGRRQVGNSAQRIQARTYACSSIARTWTQSQRRCIRRTVWRGLLDRYDNTHKCSPEKYSMFSPRTADSESYKTATTVLEPHAWKRHRRPRDDRQFHARWGG
jgi:hypothetical protein